MPEPETRSAHAHAHRRRALAFGLLTAGCVAAYWIDEQTNHKAPPPLKIGLEINPTSVDFGDVLETSQFSWTVSLNNPTPAAIDIKRFDTGCDCTTVQPTSLSIPPGESRSVVLTIDLTKKRPDQVNLPYREFRLNVEPILNNGDRPARWRIRGRVQSLLTVTPRFIHFGERLVTGSLMPGHKVSIKPYVPIADLDVWTKTDRVDAQLAATTDGYELTVTPSPRLPTGPFEEMVVLQPRSRDGRPFPKQVLPIVGHVSAPVWAVPDTVRHGACGIGSVITETIVLRSYNEAKFEVTAIETDSPDVTVEPASQPGGGPGTYYVRQIVTRQGAVRSTVRFTMKSEERRPFVIPVELTHYGVAGVGPTH